MGLLSLDHWRFCIENRGNRELQHIGEVYLVHHQGWQSTSRISMQVVNTVVTPATNLVVSVIPEHSTEANQLAIPKLTFSDSANPTWNNFDGPANSFNVDIGEVFPIQLSRDNLLRVQIFFLFVFCPLYCSNYSFHKLGLPTCLILPFFELILVQGLDIDLSRLFGEFRHTCGIISYFRFILVILMIVFWQIWV